MKVSQSMRVGLGALVLCVLVGIGSSPAITIGELDTFEIDDDLEEWRQGNAPSGLIGATQAETGGPDGEGDGFMRIQSDNNPTFGKIVVFNNDQWTGNYITAGLTSITMSVNNLGATNLNLRLAFGNAATPSSGTWFVSNNDSDVSVLAGSGWTDIEFLFAETNLTRTMGAATYATVMSNVLGLRLLHSTSPIDERGTFVAATLGVDNILAVGPDPILIGDYNEDGKVSAADFTVWRDNFGAATLENRDPDNTGAVDEEDFESWKEHYGEPEGSGAGLASVPEPTAILLVCYVAILGLAARRRLK